MKMNRSLGISTEIQKQLNDNRLGMLNSVYPKELYQYSESGKNRDRIFTVSNTLQTMLVLS